VWSANAESWHGVQDLQPAFHNFFYYQLGGGYQRLAAMLAYAIQDDCLSSR
jgi:hypothetical protein